MNEKFLMARNFFRIFTENNPVMGDSKTFCIPKAKGLKPVCVGGCVYNSKFYSLIIGGLLNKHSDFCARGWETWR